MTIRHRPVVIVGMHRSGTSLVGSIITELGFDLGDTARPDLYNTTGYFEDLSFLHLNEQLIQHLNGSWKSPPVPAAIAQFHDEIRAVYQNFVVRRTGRWGVKDPRLSLFLAPFLAVVDKPLVVFCKRDAEQVAQSLAERDLLNKAEAIALKVRYEDSVERALIGRPHFTVEFSTLIANPAETVSALSCFLGVEMKDSAVELVRSPREIRKEKRGHLVKTVITDFGKVLCNPSLLAQKRSYQRLRKYLRSAFRNMDLRK